MDLLKKLTFRDLLIIGLVAAVCYLASEVRAARQGQEKAEKALAAIEETAKAVNPALKKTGDVVERGMGVVGELMDAVGVPKAKRP